MISLVFKKDVHNICLFKNLVHYFLSTMCAGDHNRSFLGMMLGMPSMTNATYHSRPDDQGKPVRIKSPSVPTPASTWGDPAAVAIFTPGGDVPATLNGFAMAPWSPPEAPGAWEALAAGMDIAEPPFAVPAGLQPAAGAVVLEPDGRIWLAQPTNGFGGVDHVVPKGKIDPGSTPAETAIREAFSGTATFRRRITLTP